MSRESIISHTVTPLLPSSQPNKSRCYQSIAGGISVVSAGWFVGVLLIRQHLVSGEWQTSEIHRFGGPQLICRQVGMFTVVRIGDSHFETNTQDAISATVNRVEEGISYMWLEPEFSISFRYVSVMMKTMCACGLAHACVHHKSKYPVQWSAATECETNTKRRMDQ